MVADLLFRVACHGGGDEPLNVHLKRITDSAYTRSTLGGVDIDGEQVAPVIAESHDEECRREIMRYLRECLSESNSRRWQRIYGGLALAEKLMQHGSPELLTEVAQGRHFDLVQKVSFLENFDATARGCSDRRAQNVLRKKSTELRTMLNSLLEKARADLDGSPDSKDAVSTCSSGKISTATPSTAASSTTSSPSSEGSIAEPRSPSKDAHIDDAFAALREWMESIDSAGASPRSSAGESVFSLDDVDWEPLDSAPPTYMTTMLASSEGDVCDLSNKLDAADDAFFTPMPAPALAQSSTPIATAFSL